MILHLELEPFLLAEENNRIFIDFPEMSQFNE